MRQRHFQLCFQLHKYHSSMDFFRLKTLKSHTNAHAVRDRPSLKDGERQFRPGSLHELQDNSNEKQTNSNEAKNASDNAEMMVHVDESLNFHTSRNSYVSLSQDSCDKIEKANWVCISSENNATRRTIITTKFSLSFKKQHSPF